MDESPKHAGVMNRTTASKLASEHAVAQPHCLTCKKSKMALKMLYTGDQGHIGHGPLVVKEVESIQPG